MHFRHHQYRQNTGSAEDKTEQLLGRAMRHRDEGNDGTNGFIRLVFRDGNRTSRNRKVTENSSTSER